MLLGKINTWSFDVKFYVIIPSIFVPRYNIHGISYQVNIIMGIIVESELSPEGAC